MAAPTNSWARLFHKYMRTENRIENIIFKNKNLIGGGTLTSVDFVNCDFVNCTIPHFNFKDCHFLDCQFSKVRFRLRGIASGAFSNLPGSLFSSSLFTRCELDSVDFVMSSLIGTRFDQTRIKDCDFRNVTWVDRRTLRGKKWLEVASDDPFETSELTSSKFGHPFSNMMAVPDVMMIPPAYATVWKHLSEPQRAFLRLAYIMGEKPEEQFQSAV